mmetsp:Transcript_3291/g.6481  ORF Transcript_3291/g.6481 Transcript_3291/m.6481 type:complete len:133 (-) Transcript_3291:320-718(-)
MSSKTAPALSSPPRSPTRVVLIARPRSAPLIHAPPRLQEWDEGSVQSNDGSFQSKEAVDAESKECLDDFVGFQDICQKSNEDVQQDFVSYAQLMDDAEAQLEKLNFKAQRGHKSAWTGNEEEEDEAQDCLLQ